MEKETFDGNDIEVTETETSEQQVSEETEKPHKWRKPLLITLEGLQEQLLQFTLEQQRISIFIVCRIRRLMEKIFLMRTGQKLRTI